jgi:hypothetical protein
MSDNLRTMPAPTPNDAVPNAAALAGELLQVENRGAWASALDPAELPYLLSLACVAGPAQENGESPQVWLIRALKRVLEPIKTEEPGRALELLLGLADTTRGYDAITRRKRTMMFLNLPLPPDYQIESFYRRRVPPMLAFLADELVEYDRKYRMRDTYERMAGKMPASPALAVMWLDRFQYYYRMWTDLSGLENDLAVYLQARHDPQVGETRLERRRRTSLWFLARFYLHLDQFVDQRGGLWLLGDEEQAQLVADSTWYLQFHPPVTQHDGSWLSFAALEQPAPAFHLFDRKLDEDDSGRLILTQWRAWLEACQCDEQAPVEACEVHIVLRHCRRYMEIIDAEWNRIVEWFTGPPGKSAITPEQVAEMNRRWRLPATDDAPDQQG